MLKLYMQYKKNFGDRRPLIAPSVLACDFSCLGTEIKKIEKNGGDWVHWDIMDGHFVPNLTFGPDIIKSVRSITALPFDVHLMVEQAYDLVSHCLEAGADCITFHWEAEVHHHRLIDKIHKAGAKAGISIVPSTPVSAIEQILPLVDIVLVMSVNPGFGGQAFIPFTLDKIRQLDKIRIESQLNYQISVDGGVNEKTFVDILEAGADILVTGSGFFKATDPSSYIKMLKS